MNHPSFRRGNRLSALLSSFAISFLAVPTLQAQDAEFAGIVKSQRYIQSGPTTVVLEEDAFVFDSFTESAEANSLTSVTLGAPGGTEVEIPADGDSEFFYDSFFESLGALNTSFPNGAYSLTVVGVNDGEKVIGLNLNGDSYPVVTRFTNYEETQAIDHTGEMTFSWNPIAGGTAETWVFFEIENSDENLVFESPFPGEAGSLNGLSTSLTIPPNTLAFGETYTARLGVVNIVDESSDYPGVDAIAGYQTFLNIEIQTNGPDNTAPDLIHFAPFWGEEDVSTNSVITFEFDEPMDQSVDPADAITWTNVGDPTDFEYRWSPNGEILFCHFTTGLPTDNGITWALNEAGSAAKLRDVAGNHLLYDAHQGEFFTNSSSNFGAVPDVIRMEVFKAKEFGQSGETPVDLNNYFVDFFVDLSGVSTVSSVDIDIAGGSTIDNAGMYEPDFLSIEGEQSFSSEGDLNAAFPDSDYLFTLHTFNDGDPTVTLNPGSESFPAAPTIRNFSTTQNWDSTQPFTITWDPMPGGTSSDAIFLYIEGENDDFFETPCIGEPGVLDGNATSITIPANTLPPGSTLDAELVFAKINTNDTTQYPGVRSVAGIGTITRFEIQTSGDPFIPLVDLRKTSTLTSVKITGVRGDIFDVQASNNLINWNYVGTVWLSDNPDGFLSSGTLEDFSDPGAVRRFYRIEDAVPE